MDKNQAVKVETQVKKSGQLTIHKVIWQDKREYKVQRVLHICKHLDENKEVLRYTILIEGKQRYLFRDKDKWYVKSIA